MQSLINAFELMWDTALPVVISEVAGPDAFNEPTAETLELLTMLAAGLTDDAIARELGVSNRTIARRVSRLGDWLGVKGRFQLGFQACRLGWLPGGD